MIIYNPLDGYTIQPRIKSQPKYCFLMIHLGDPVPPIVEEIRVYVKKCCARFDYTVIDAGAEVTGRDFLLKIWRLIASTPLSVGILHEGISQTTQANIMYELGVAQALGKETVLIKSSNVDNPSDLSRTEYVTFDDNFMKNFTAYLKSIYVLAESYELMADQLEKDPILSLDYLKRAFLINGDIGLRKKARDIVASAKLDDRAANSVEMIAASF